MKGEGGRFQGQYGAQRRLSTEELALWKRVTDTIIPLEKAPEVAAPVVAVEPVVDLPVVPVRKVKGRVPPPAAPAVATRPVPKPVPAPRMDGGGLDGSWDKKLVKGVISPDFTLDLHGFTLETAYTRLDQGLTLAIAQGARVVLLITGRPRPAPGPMDRGSQRGAIRAKFLDWLAHGSHASRIAAVRAAHPKHGGAGAVYIILKRGR